MELTFSGNITAADTGRRELVGQIVPFGRVGNTSAGKVVFEVGSILNLDASNVKLLREHNHTDVLGWAQEFTANPAGIVGRFRVAQTHAGDDVLVEASERLRDGFSIGATIDAYTIKDGVIHVTAALINEVSVVATPAFAEARITDVAAAETPAEVSNPEIEDKETMNPETETVVSEDVAAETPTVTASAPQTTPIFTAPRVAPMSSAEYVEASIRGAFGDHNAKMRVMAADDTTNNTGLTLPEHLNSFVTNTFAANNRPAINACGGAMAMGASGMSFTIPRLTQAPTAGAATEGSSFASDDTESDYLTVDVSRYMGKQTISFELLDRSAPNFGELVLNELHKDYAKATNAAVVAALTSGGTAASTTAGTVAGLQSFVATEAVAAYMATGGDAATELLASGAWWSALVAANDGNDRPLFNALQPSNAAGRVGLGAPAGEPVFGANFWVDHTISTSGLVDNSAFLIAPDAVAIWETPTTQYRLTIIDDSSVQVALNGYLAVKVLKAGGVRKFNLT